MKLVSFFTVLALVLSCFIFNSCSSIKEVGSTSKEYPVTIFINNNSGKNPVHIAAKLESWGGVQKDTNMSVADDDLYSYMGAKGIRQKYNLQEGNYRIFVKAEKECALLDCSFILDRPLWLLIEYLNESHFRLNVYHRAPVFG